MNSFFSTAKGRRPSKFVGLETDKYKKAKILLKIANRFKKIGRKVSARTYASRALSNQPSLGRAYLLIASLYADSAQRWTG